MQKVFRRRLRSSEDWKQWFEQQKTRACVPHTVGGDAGYSLLHFSFKVCVARR